MKLLPKAICCFQTQGNGTRKGKALRGWEVSYIYKVKDFVVDNKAFCRGC